MDSLATFYLSDMVPAAAPLFFCCLAAAPNPSGRFGPAQRAKKRLLGWTTEGHDVQVTTLPHDVAALVVLAPGRADQVPPLFDVGGYSAKTTILGGKQNG